MKPVSTLPLLLPALGLSAAASAMAAEESLQPVIARMQVIYSLVSHHSHIAARVNYYNASGMPQGNQNYAVPHLVYDPAVTLYNPHNRQLKLDRSRVQLSDPPVGFRFSKANEPLRAEWASPGNFLGLGRLQNHNESATNARKHLTLSLGGGTAVDYDSDSIFLEPGESKTFMIRVEPNWTWGLETSTANTRSFYDGNFGLLRSLRDGRTGNEFGAEAIAALDFRAGLQT
ncbi:MAG: hypothetical protein EOP85_23665, partial [Verrucomicrobiaceae bacterium]